MIEKQLQFQAVNEQGQLVIQPLFIGQGLEKTAEALEMRSNLHPRVQDFVRAVRPTKAGIYILVNALGASEYWSANVNGDAFPEKALIHSPPDWNDILTSPDRAREVGAAWPYGYPTFMAAHPFLHHSNKDPSRAFGRVELATWNPKMHRVELVIYLDRALCMQFDAISILDKIENGEYPSVSMGCKVPFDICSICGNKSKTRMDYCQHALTMMNKILPDGRKVYVINTMPKFFDISFVFIGADKTAKVMAKLAQKGNQVCMGDFCSVPRLSADVGEVFSSKEASLADSWAELSDPTRRAIIGGAIGLGTGTLAGYSHGRLFPKIGPNIIHAQALDNLSPDYISSAGISLDDQARRQEAVSSIARTSKLSRPVVSDDPSVSIKRTGRNYLAEIDSGAKDNRGRKAPVIIHGTWRPGDNVKDVTTKAKSESLKVPHGHTKTADPVDELPTNFGYTKEKAQADREADRLIAARKSSRSGSVSLQEKTAANYKYPTLGLYLLEKSSVDIGRERAMSQYRRQKLGEMYGVDLMNKAANDPIKKKIRIQGIPVWIEWLKGETREYKKGGVVKYERLMEADYGYIPGTIDSDGEELDVYLGPDRTAKNAYVIRQLKKTGGFDEHKVMIGYSSKSTAKASYIHHMGGTPERFGGMQAIPVSSLMALYGDNKATKEKVACACEGVGDDCGGSFEKLAALLFPISKSASHAKLSEIIKSLPAGPFTKETLPKLESAEKDIPKDVLDTMSGLPLGSALSTSTMAGMVLKPKEFQRIILMSIGERPLADELDKKRTTFGRTSDVDDSIQLNENSVDDGLMDLLRQLGLIKDRSAAAPALQSRSMAAASADKPFRSIGSSSEKTASGPLMAKLSAAYNGYRRSILRKAASISNYMTNDPQLRAELFGSGMAQAFAGGIDKVATTSVFSPDSLAYLVGAYTDRDLHMTNEIVASLALTGTVVEAA